MRWVGWLLSVALLAQAAGPTSLVPLDETGLAALLAQQKGKVLLVSFWATWCARCRAEMPALVQLASKLRPNGFVLATVSVDEPEQKQEALALLQQQQVPGPAYWKQAKNDEAFINHVDSKWSGALPASVLYDRQGRKVKTYIGEVDAARLEADIRKVK